MRFLKNRRAKKKEKRLLKDIDTTRKILRYIDLTMQSMNMPHYKRKQIWTGFIKSADQRANILEILNGVKP